jgi:hypothetical protein
MVFEIQIITCDRGLNVAGLTQSMISQPSQWYPNSVNDIQTLILCTFYVFYEYSNYFLF